MGSNGMTILILEYNCCSFLVMHSVIVGEVNLHKEELASRLARSQLSHS